MMVTGMMIGVYRKVYKTQYALGDLVSCKRHIHMQVTKTEGKKETVASPTNQDHRPVLHFLKISHIGMLLSLPLDCRANDTEELSLPPSPPEDSLVT